MKFQLRAAVKSDERSDEKGKKKIPQTLYPLSFTSGLTITFYQHQGVMMKLISPLLPLLLLLFPLSINSTSRDVHHVDGSELDPQEILTRHPRLLEIMNMVGSSTLPVPLIIREYPEVWLDLQVRGGIRREK